MPDLHSISVQNLSPEIRASGSVGKENLNEHLFEEVKRSDNYEAFEIMYRRFYQRLASFAYRFTQSSDKAEEVVSDVFYKLWKNRKNIEITSSLQSYLFTSVRNKCLDKLRVENRVSHCDDSVLLNYRSTISTPLQHTLEEELRKRIEIAIEALPRDRRRIFRLSRDNGLKYKEIAALLDISIKTVETQMGRALKFLRGELKEYLHQAAI